LQVGFKVRLELVSW